MAFATGNHLPSDLETNIDVSMLPNRHIDPLFHGVVEATEEAILNALCGAETMIGREGRVATQLPLDRVVELVGGRAH